MLYFLGLGYTPDIKGIAYKMGMVSLENGHSLGIPINEIKSEEELKKQIEMIIVNVSKLNKEKISE